MPTSADAATIFVGRIDKALVTLEQIQFTCAPEIYGNFKSVVPRWATHPNCRFRWADDYCTSLRFLPANYKTKTAGAGCTTTLVFSSDLTEDTSAPPYTAEPVTADASTDKITLTAHGLADGARVQVGGDTVPGGLDDTLWYYVVNAATNDFKLSLTEDGSAVNITSAGTSVTINSSAPYGTDLIDALADGDIDTSSEQATHEGYRVRSSHGADEHWRFGLSGADWGDNNQGYWQIPTGQEGLKNAELKPWITFDMGSAQQPRLWRVTGRRDLDRDLLPRLILFFNSPDNSTWTFQGYYECPPRLNEVFDVLLPNATSARYWRICVRTRWSDNLRFSIFRKVYAHEITRHWWRSGRIKFADDTTTVALRGVSRRVLESYAGQVLTEPLPVAPANGDTFVIERGCGRAFNDCSERGNTENFGGFDSMPFEEAVR